MPTTLGPELVDRLLDRLRHAEQYLEATRVMVEDARSLLEAAREDEEGGEEE